MKNQKFIIVKDEQTANKLFASGFKVVSQINGIYTFMNQVPKHFNFDEIDVKKLAYSNMLQFN
jgi:hypothetical protein